MVKLTVYLKFRLPGRNLTHSGNQVFREPDLPCCRLALEIFKEEYAQMGWILVEEHDVRTDFIGGWPCGSGR